MKQNVIKQNEMQHYLGGKERIELCYLKVKLTQESGRGT